MSGHSKWSKIKHQKAVEDLKRGQVFSKIAKEITAQARVNPDTETNPSLKSLIEKAHSVNMPKENIERAIGRATLSGGQGGQVFTLEAYGPGSEGIVIKGETDNKNRSLPEIKQILSRHGAKLVSPGAVAWNFEGNTPKMTKPASKSLPKLLEELEQHPDITGILTDAL